MFLKLFPGGNSKNVFFQRFSNLKFYILERFLSGKDFSLQIIFKNNFLKKYFGERNFSRFLEKFQKFRFSFFSPFLSPLGEESSKM